MIIKRKSKPGIPRISFLPLPDASEMEDAFTVLKNYDWLHICWERDAHDCPHMEPLYRFQDMSSRLKPISDKYGIPVTLDPWSVKGEHPLHKWALQFEKRFLKLNERSEKVNKFRRKMQEKGKKFRKKSHK